MKRMEEKKKEYYSSLAYSFLRLVVSEEQPIFISGAVILLILTGILLHRVSSVQTCTCMVFSCAISCLGI